MNSSRHKLALSLLFALVSACSTTRQNPWVAESPVATKRAPVTPSPSQSPLPPPSPPLPTPLTGVAAKAVLTPAGITAPVVGPHSEGLVVGTPCGRNAVVRQGVVLQGATVVLDPGHGGTEPGAVGQNGLTEKELNLAVTGFARTALKELGANVVLTRTADYRITLQARAAIVKSLRPRAFVSIHHNGGADGPRDGPGTETFYQTSGASAAESKRLAGLVYEEVVGALSQFQGIAWVADRDAGAKYRKSESGNDYYGILRHTQGTPAVLSEAAFLSNPPEADLMTREDVRRSEGQAIARALNRFLNTKDPGSGFVEPYARTEPAGSGGGTANCIDPPL